MKTELLTLLKTDRKKAERISFILTGDDLIEFAEAFQKIDDKLLRKKEVSEQLEITEPTLFSWTKKGIIIPTKIGGKLFYKQSEVDRIKRGDI